MRATSRSVDTAASPRAGLLPRAGWWRLAVLALLCAIASEMLLPLAHASAGSAGSRSIFAQSGPAPGIEISRGAASAAHDPATCGVCQSLLHANPAAPPPAAIERWLPELASLFVVSAPRSHVAVARTGNPPRAPPLAALSLA